MATKKAPKAHVEALFDAAGSRYELVVVWDPGQTQPVTFSLVMAGTKILVADRLMVDSPVVLRRLPDPDVNGKIPLVWSLVPEVPLRMMAIALVDTQTGARVTVDSKSDLERGVAWRGEKLVGVPTGSGG